jgi:hypothetical protein
VASNLTCIGLAVGSAKEVDRLVAGTRRGSRSSCTEGTALPEVRRRGAAGPKLPAVDESLAELARARRAGDLDTAAVLPGRRAERRRRLAEPDLEFRACCARGGLPASPAPQLERAWDAWQAEEYRRGEIGQRPAGTGNPVRLR